MVAILTATLMLAVQTQSAAQPIKPPTSPAAPIQVKGKFATDLDRQVLEALLLAVEADNDYPPPASADKKVIVLHRRTPKLIEPVIDTFRLNYDTGGRVLPKDAWDDLVRRNTVRLDKHSREVSYEGLSFNPSIQVGNAFPGPEPPFLGKTFDEVFPQARGWVEAWVPGYSKDQKTAVVRANVGPTDKVATLTAILKLQEGKWAVVWHRYSVYN